MALVKWFGQFLAVVCLLTAEVASADSTLWTGGGPDANWSTAANWTNGVPTTTTDTYFSTNVNETITITNDTVVSDNLTVQTLRYLLNAPFNYAPWDPTNAIFCNFTNAITYFNTQIADGKTLTVSDSGTTNSLLVGAETSCWSASVVGGKNSTATIFGLAGTLDINAPQGNVIVRNGGLNLFNGGAVLDMSNLGTFKTLVDQILFAGDGWNGVLRIKYIGGTNANNEAINNDRYRDRAAAHVILARTNIMKMTSSLATNAPGFVFANGIGNNAFGSTLKLGITNAFLTDRGVLMGGGRSGTSTVGFNTALGEPNYWAYFRNTAGTGPQLKWGVTDVFNIPGQGGMNCTVDLSAGSVDAWVNQLIVGRSHPDVGRVQTSTGTLILSSGKVVADSALIGWSMNHYTAAIKGIMQINGPCELVVSNALQLGRFMNTAITNGFSQAKLDVTGGGSVKVYGGLVSSFVDPLNFDSQLTVDGSSLYVRGAFGPFLNFNLLGNSTLTLDIATVLDPAGALCYVTNFTTATPITLNVAGSIPATGQFPLIKYATLAGGAAGDDITSFTLPPYVKGFLSNNVANSSIDLVVTNVLPSNIQITQNGLVAGALQLSGTSEWTNAPYRVVATTNLADSSSWVAVGSGAFTGGVFSFSELISTNYPLRFYRVVAP